MSSQGPNSPGTLASSNAVGTFAWTNPGNAASSNNSYAVCNNLNPGAISHYLKATNFGFSIPAGSTIDGIKVEIERQNPLNYGIFDKYVKIVKSDGSIGTTNKADANYWIDDIADHVVSYGGATDKWGETWAYGDINDVDFGVVLSVYNTTGKSNCTGLVDHIKITVYYTAGASSSIKAVSGVAQAGIGKFGGVASADINKIGGVAND